MELTIIREEQSVELTLDVFKSTNSNTEGINRRLLSSFQLLSQKMEEAWGSYCEIYILNGSTISIKAAFGDLISEFVELDYGPIIEGIKEFLELKIPESQNEYENYIDYLDEVTEAFLLTHPFSLLDFIYVKEIFTNYYNYCGYHIKCVSLMKDPDQWIENPNMMLLPGFVFLRDESRELIDELIDYKITLVEKELSEETVAKKHYDFVSRMKNIMSNIRRNVLSEIQSIEEALIYLVHVHSKIREDYHEIINRIYNLEQKSDLYQFSVAQRLESWAGSNDRSFLAKKIEYVHKIKRDDLGNVVLTEEYDVYLSDACFLVLKELVLSHTVIKRCEHCKKTFKPQNRTDEKYCRRQVGQTQNTCHTIGPLRKSMNKENLNKYQRLYAQFRERYRSRVNRKTMKKEDFEEWKKDATKKRDQVKNKEIYYSEFENWVLTKDKKLTKKRIEEKLSK